MPFATHSTTPAAGPNPFDALLDPRAALEAHERLAAALGERCVRWSPLDARPSPRVAEEADDLEVVVAADSIELDDEPLAGQRLWP